MKTEPFTFRVTNNWDKSVIIADMDDLRFLGFDDVLKSTAIGESCTNPAVKGHEFFETYTRIS
jgi:hypothetical protein